MPPPPSDTTLRMPEGQGRHFWCVHDKAQAGRAGEVRRHWLWTGLSALRKRVLRIIGFRRVKG